MAGLPQRARDSIRPVSSVAIFTLVQDEPEFLPVWKAHYAPAGDVYILDHESSPPVEGGIALHHKWSWDFTWWHDMAQRFQEALFEAGYQTVVFATPDEFLVPIHVPLVDYFRRYSHGAVVRPMAYDIVDMSRASPGYDLLDTPVGVVYHDDKDGFLDWTSSRPWEDRRWWVRCSSYDKPLILREPYRWSWGLHSTKDDDPRPESDLRLLHLHRVDYESGKIRHARKRLRLNHKDITEFGSGAHNLLTEEPAYNQWFYHDVAFRERTPWTLHARAD